MAITVPADLVVHIGNYDSNWYLSTDGQGETPDQLVQIWNRDPLAEGGRGSLWRITPVSGAPSERDTTYRITLVNLGGDTTVCLSARRSRGEDDNDPAHQGGQGLVTAQTIAPDDPYQLWHVVPVDAEHPVFEISPVPFPSYALGGQNGFAALDTLVRLTRKWGGGAVAAVQSWIVTPHRRPA